jgi:hypothetical protein
MASSYSQRRHYQNARAIERPNLSSHVSVGPIKPDIRKSFKTRTVKLFYGDRSVLAAQITCLCLSERQSIGAVPLGDTSEHENISSKHVSIERQSELL